MLPLRLSLAGLAASWLAGSLQAQAPSVTELMTKRLADAPGKEVLIITVEYPPGGADPVHRHYAHSFVYVLQGSIVMQVKGGRQVTLHPGQTFYEGPEDIHAVGRNASDTRPAKFLVFLIKGTGTPVLVPATESPPPQAMPLCLDGPGPSAGDGTVT